MKIEKNAPPIRSGQYSKSFEAVPERHHAAGEGGRSGRKPDGSRVAFAIDAYVHTSAAGIEIVLHNEKESLLLLQEAEKATKLLIGIVEKLGGMLETKERDAFAWEMLVKKLNQVAKETNFKGIYLLNEGAGETTLQLRAAPHMLQVPLLDMTAPALGIELNMQLQKQETLEAAKEALVQHMQQLLDAATIMRFHVEGKVWASRLLHILYDTDHGAGKIIHDLPVLRSIAEFAAALLSQPEKAKTASVLVTAVLGAAILILLYIAVSSY